MKTTSTMLVAAILALSACGETPEQTNAANEADDFAARINGESNAAAPSAAPVAPAPAEPLENTPPETFLAGTQTDPSSTCAAAKMAPFIGRIADDATRAQIMNTAKGILEVRFIQPGSASISPDPASSRLNLMLDNQNIIREARCG